MRVPPQSYRLYKTLYAFAYNRLCRTWPGKISLLWLAFTSGYGCAWSINQIMTREERKLSGELKQLEEIEKMLEKAANLRAAAAAHRRELQEAEKEEARLREAVREAAREWKSSSFSSDESKSRTKDWWKFFSRDGSN
jgi:hypothetical protein